MIKASSLSPLPHTLSPPSHPLPSPLPHTDLSGRSRETQESEEALADAAIWSWKARRIKLLDAVPTMPSHWLRFESSS